MWHIAIGSIIIGRPLGAFNTKQVLFVAFASTKLWKITINTDFSSNISIGDCTELKKINNLHIVQPTYPLNQIIIHYRYTI